MNRKKHILKRALALLLIVSTMLATIGQSDRNVWANENAVQLDTVTEDTIQTEATSSFGNLLNKELEEKLDEQKENAGYNILALEMTGVTANVTLEALEECELIVGIYDESGTTMLGSGTVDVPENAENATVTIDIDAMPTYFDVKAYLVDSETLEPLCQVFDCPNYTQEMQEFLQKTVSDFDEDQVLNLDDSADNNFAVFQDDVKYVEEQENVNQVITEDEENNTYVIENAGTEIQALQSGDITALEYNQGQVLIIKVASIVLDGTTATITGEETDLENVFKYVKLDTESYTEDATVDTSSLEEGITYLGMSDVEEEQAEEDELSADRVQGEGTIKKTLTYSLNKGVTSEHTEVKISGSIGLSLNARLKVYITLNKQYLEFTVGYEFQTKVAISGKVEFKFPLGRLEFSPVAGIYVRITPKIVARFSGSISINTTIKQQLGGAVTIGKGYRDLSTKPQKTFNMIAEASFYLGLEIEPEIVVLTDKLVEAGIKFGAGLEISLSKIQEDPAVMIHMCKSCMEGQIALKADVTFGVKFLNMDVLSIEKKYELGVKLADCHYSMDYNEFQLAVCPRKGYKAQIQVVDSSGRALPGAILKGTFLVKDNGTVKQVSSLTADSKGRVNAYLLSGQQRLWVEHDGMSSEVKINKKAAGEKITVRLEMKIDSTNFPDSNFRKYVLNKIDTNKDGKLSKSEIQKTKVIEISEKSIKSVKGIEHFSELEELYCDNNKNLYSIDLSNNKKLLVLSCNNNGLNSLDVSENQELKSLSCYGNLLKTINIDNNKELTKLWCMDNQLNSLNLKYNIKLKDLECFSNRLQQLDVSNNVELETLVCDYNELTTLDVSNNKKLKMLYCDDNVILIGGSRSPDESNATNMDLNCEEENADVTDADTEEDMVISSPMTYSDLMPNAVYNFYIMKDTENDISYDNLLYIIQITSDENGQATIPFAYNQTCDLPQAKLVGMEKLDIADAEVTIEDLYYTGETQDAEPAVVYKGTALEPGKDYTITGDYQATEIGTYTIQIVGTGLYKGSLEKSYQILPITVAEIKLSQSTLSMKKGETAALTVTITPENATDKAVDWTSSDTKIATVDSTGKVTAVSAGTASITCTAQDGSDKKATCKVTVTDPTPPKPSVVKVAKITLNKTTASVGKGKTMQLTATVTPTNATNKAVTWKSSNTKIATVSSTGKVTTKSAGTVTITCTAKDGSGKKATCKVTVTESKPPVKPTVKVTKVTLNKKTETLSPKETLTLKATVIPTNATNKGVIWKSSNTKIATVSSTGKVTAKAAGTVTITCTAKDGSGKKATCRITVYNNTQAYVARIYTKALGRAAEPAGLNYWVGEINAKRRTPVQVAEEFFFAPEFVNKKLSNTEYVKVLYRTFMGREYDKGGLDYWVARLNKGESRKSVLEAFAGCPEFQKIVKSFGL